MGEDTGVNAGYGAGAISGSDVDELLNSGMVDPQYRRIEETRRPAFEANTGQNLRAMRKGGEMKSLDERIADDQVSKHVQPDPVKDPEGYKQALTERIKYLSDQAKKSKEIGNITAMNTFNQVASVLIDRINAMQTAEAEQVTRETASQPARMSPPASGVANPMLPNPQTGMGGNFR
jgi:hypothetical protein